MKIKIKLRACVFYIQEKKSNENEEKNNFLTIRINYMFSR